MPLENSPRFKAAYHAKTATNVKEDEELIAAGFEYVTERDGTQIYRKRKQKIAKSKIVETYPCRGETFINKKH